MLPISGVYIWLTKITSQGIDGGANVSLVYVSTARVINHGPAILLSGLVRPSLIPLVSDIRVGKVRSFDRDLVSMCVCAM